MYVLLTMNNKKTKVKILALFFSFFYMFAYQLNSLVCGFSYLGLGLDFIIAIIIIMKSNIKGLIRNILLFFFNFGLMFTYYYFAPVVFLTIFWQILQENKENGNKLFNVKNICGFILSEVLSGSLLTSKTDVYSNGDATIYCGVAFSNLKFDLFKF